MPGLTRITQPADRIKKTSLNRRGAKTAKKSKKNSATEHTEITEKKEEKKRYLATDGHKSFCRGVPGGSPILIHEGHEEKNGNLKRMQPQITQITRILRKNL